MTNPTTPFSWQMPTSTDLVTDLPADFEVFGQAVATSMADLLGGTSGQILAKASNTDMDFTWVTNDVGDITAVTAGTGITGGGTSGAVTVSFDQANFGGGQYAAAKNKIINGNFANWQRGTTFANPGVFAYFSDRFYSVSNNSGGTVTLSRQTFTGTDIPVAGAQFYFRSAGTSPTGASFNTFGQKIENVQTFAGQSVTISFYAKSDSARNVTPNIIQNFGSGGSTEVTTSGSAIALTTSWARYSQTFTVPSISGKTIGTSSYLAIEISQPINVSHTIEYYGIQAEAGSTATPFQTATGTIQGELAACMYYYQQWGGTSTFGEANGQFYSSSDARMTRYLPARMRTNSQTVTFPSGTYTNWIEEVGIAQRTPTAFTLSGTGFGHITFTATGMTGATVNQQAQYGVPAGAITISAEL